MQAYALHYALYVTPVTMLYNNVRKMSRDDVFERKMRADWKQGGNPTLICDWTRLDTRYVVNCQNRLERNISDTLLTVPDAQWTGGTSRMLRGRFILPWVLMLVILGGRDRRCSVVHRASSNIRRQGKVKRPVNNRYVYSFRFGPFAFLTQVRANQATSNQFSYESQPSRKVTRNSLSVGYTSVPCDARWKAQRRIAKRNQRAMSLVRDNDNTRDLLTRWTHLR